MSAFAGDTFNTAVYAARILGGGVGFKSRAGEDPLSADLRDFARAEWLDLSLIARDPARQIGMYSVSPTGRGSAAFTIGATNRRHGRCSRMPPRPRRCPKPR